MTPWLHLQLAPLVETLCTSSTITSRTVLRQRAFTFAWTSGHTLVKVRSNLRGCSSPGWGHLTFENELRGTGIQTRVRECFYLLSSNNSLFLPARLIVHLITSDSKCSSLNILDVRCTVQQVKRNSKNYLKIIFNLSLAETNTWKMWKQNVSNVQNPADCSN